MVVEEQRLGTALAFVIAGTRTDRVDVAAIALSLRGVLRIAVDLGGRGLHDRRPVAPCEIERIDGAEHIGEQGSNRIALIIRRRCRRREIENQRRIHVKGTANIVLDDPKT
ncbi:hypothetical protein AJ87_25085 [Rhizobium yanglingense]|nr:hypothetical protein AJ87_25085 [Rhizobium yanglingense]